MPRALQAVALRLDPATLEEIDHLMQAHNDQHEHADRIHYHAKINRSEMFRHVLRTGLDVLTSQPPLKL